MKVLNDFLARVVDQIINPLILLMAAVAFVVFLWGVVQLVRKSGEPAERAKGQKAIGWGLIGFVIMFGAYGILNILTNTFNVKPNFDIRPGFVSKP